MQSQDNMRRATKIWESLEKRYEIPVECESAIIDALTDIRHLCDRDGYDFGNLDRIAHNHYLAELEEAKDELSSVA